MYCSGGNERALISRPCSNDRRIAYVNKRRQGAKLPGPIRIDLLLDGKGMDRRIVNLGGFLGIDISYGGIRGTEVDADLHAAWRSRTLNSNFQRRPSTATHHNSS